MKRLAILSWVAAGAILAAATVARSEHSQVPPTSDDAQVPPTSGPAQVPPTSAAAAIRGPALTTEDDDHATRQARVAASTSRPARTGSARVRPLVGDAALRDAFDLAAARLEDGHYRVQLDDGRTATLTLDPTLQAAAESVLARARAPMSAVVVMTVDGRILAMAGRQDSEPAPRLATTVWAPAASIFKVVTAAALVDAGLRSGSRVCYHGGVRSVVAQNLVDDARLDQLCNDLRFGLSRSQNAIIAKLAHRHLDPDKLRGAARKFGFGAAPDFALPTEPARAAIPDSSLDFARVAAGFWKTELSPLGGALVAAVVASGGMSITPRIIRAVEERGATIPVEPVPPVRVLSARVAREVAQMMVDTIDTGTARAGFHDNTGKRFLPGVRVAGKTGTLTRQSPSYLQYSWFVGFAPADQPEIIVSVLLGNPERWHLKAHTAARLLLQKAL